MTASSFNCTPGLPILHSKDLVNWTLVNHAVKNLPGERFKEVQLGSGIWAPAIRYHAGKYWIVFPMVEEGIYVTMPMILVANGVNRGALSRREVGSIPASSGTMTGRLT